ncbi:NAD(P)H-dependent glycerol-3-phosphate dehydrogenase [soil metagenome]
MSTKVAAVGAGTWGLSLAAAAARAGSDVVVVSRRREGDAPEGVRRTTEMAAIREARRIPVAVPSHVAREIGTEMGDHVDGRHFVVHGVRGLVGEKLETVCDVLRQETPVRRLGALGGPALADDLLGGKPSVLICGSAYPEVTDAVDEALGCRSCRIYSTPDLRGLEWASALVGCLAIGIGYAQTLALSPGLVAAVITRAITEGSRIAAAAGGDERTLLGLAGYGDLLACIAQKERPEVRLGAALARGLPIAEAMRAAELRVEAIELIPRISTWAEGMGVHTPIFSALGDAIFGKRTPSDLIELLMTRPKD